jgi:TIR domain-containing protein
VTRVFISYRREDTAAGYAAFIHRELAREPGTQAFRDVDSLPFGVDWEEHIRAALRDCDVAFVLIGSLWLTAADERGRRRLEDPADVLRLEVAEVIARRRVRVIPVVFGSARMPKADELPPDIRPLASKQALFWYLNEPDSYNLQKIRHAVRLGALADVDGPAPARIGGALSARVLALCAELLDEISDPAARREIVDIQRDLQTGGGAVGEDAERADAALEALDTLSWASPGLRFVRDRVEELRDSGPDMQIIDLAKWYDRLADGEIALPDDKRAELERLLDGQSTAERLGLERDASGEEIRDAASGRVLVWRRFGATALASPTEQRVAGDVVAFYEGLAVNNG